MNNHHSSELPRHLLTLTVAAGIALGTRGYLANRAEAACSPDDPCRDNPTWTSDRQLAVLSSFALPDQLSQAKDLFTAALQGISTVIEKTKEASLPPSTEATSSNETQVLPTQLLNPNGQHHEQNKTTYSLSKPLSEGEALEIYGAIKVNQEPHREQNGEISKPPYFYWDWWRYEPSQAGDFLVPPVRRYTHTDLINGETSVFADDLPPGDYIVVVRPTTDSNESTKMGDLAAYDPRLQFTDYDPGSPSDSPSSNPGDGSNIPSEETPSEDPDVGPPAPMPDPQNPQ